MRSLFILALAVALGVPAFAQTSTQTKPSCASGDPVVWVNTSSHVYHMEGSKYYGNTKSGKYLCKSAADTAGNHQDKTEAAGGSKAAPAPSPTPTPKYRWFHKPKPSPSPTAS
jgi:hypothetical protein